MHEVIVVEPNEKVTTQVLELLKEIPAQLTTVDSASSALSKIELQQDNKIVVASYSLFPSFVACGVPVLVYEPSLNLSNAVKAIKQGAANYSHLDDQSNNCLAGIIPTILNSLDSNAAGGHFSGIQGQCPQMAVLYDQMRKVAPTNTSVLIQGETGTGKELVARAIHAASSRASKPLVSVNCAAIPETLIESELFGYEKGAFTGANTNRIGLIEAADEGTLFLDEIGELPLEAQARLLRFLQEGEIRAIGSIQTRKVNVRLIAATHRDLKSMANANEFREDLYYRINVIPLKLPPLRNRGQDIAVIATSYLEKLGSEFSKPNLRFTTDALAVINSYRWPGNVRELRNALERAVILTDNQEIEPELLGVETGITAVYKTSATSPPPSASNAINPDPNSDEDDTQSEELSLEDYFQSFVLEHQQTMSETELAKKLGVSRKCLWERRQKLGIPRKKNAIL